MKTAVWFCFVCVTHCEESVEDGREKGSHYSAVVELSQPKEASFFSYIFSPSPFCRTSFFNFQSFRRKKTRIINYESRQKALFSVFPLLIDIPSLLSSSSKSKFECSSSKQCHRNSRKFVKKIYEYGQKLVLISSSTTSTLTLPFPST